MEYIKGKYSRGKIPLPNRKQNNEIISIIICNPLSIKDTILA